MYEKNKIKEYLNWLAGFYEGEGTTGFYKEKKRGTTRLVVGIVQKEAEVLLEMKKYFGYGSVAHLRKGKVGEVYVFTLSGYNAENFLKSIYPFMRSTKKTEQAKNALYLWRNRLFKKKQHVEKTK
jgi:hypothetical protein